MALDIFTHKVGDTPLVWPTDPERQAELAVSVLDAVQTIVDVLVDEGVTYEVGFANLDSAYTDYRRKRIVISAKPMTEGGRTFEEVVSILTGFAVHEIGHTKLSAKAELVREWPNKVTPHRLANILEDVRLEDWTIQRFRGLANVFTPTLVWVAEATCPKFDLTYGKTIHARLNFAGQAVRYEPFVTFGDDAETQRELAWWREWGQVTADTTNAQLLELVREGIAHIKAGAEYEPEPEAEDGDNIPEGDPGQGGDEPNTGNPDADDLDDDTEGEDTDDDDDTEGGDGESDETDTEGEDGESNGDDDESDEDSDDEDEGGSATDADPLDDDTDGEAEGEETDGEAESEGGEPNDDDTEGGDGDPDSDEDAEGDQYHDGQLDEGETLDREETDSPMGDGAGGSGKAISEDSDVDEGLDEDKLAKTQDDLNENVDDVQQQHADKQLERNVQEERTTARIDAGAFGKMKVKVIL